MKSIVFAVLFVVAVTKAAYAPGAVSYGGGPAPVSYGAPAPSVPCPKSIVVSCAPSVQAVPCAGGARGYGAGVGGYAPSVGAVHQGSYTENAPQYIVPSENVGSEQWLASASSQYDNQYAAQQEYVPYTTYGGGVY